MLTEGRCITSILFEALKNAFKKKKRNCLATADFI